MVKKNKCVVIGATGFVGSHLCDDLESRGFRVQRITRIKNKIDSAEGVIYCDFSKIEQIKETPTASTKETISRNKVAPISDQLK